MTVTSSLQDSVKTVGGKEASVSRKYIEQVSSDPSKSSNLCKVCGEPGLRVLQVTVLSHINSQHWNLISDGFRFSSTPTCPVIYFNNGTGVYFLKDEVKTRFGPKENEDPRPICYCLGVMEEHVRYEALKKGCCDSLEDIVEYTKAGTGRWCLTTNPSGKCCREYLPKIVEKYLSMKESRQARPKLQAVKEKLEQIQQPSKHIVLKVGGMTCESCATHVRSVIEKMGGKNIKVSMQEGSAELLAPADIQPDEIAKSIEEFGYKTEVTKVERTT